MLKTLGIRRFLGDRRGNVAMIFGLLAIPLVGAAGSAIDFSYAYRQRSIVQDAIDAAALAANRKLGTSTTAQIQAEANYFYQANVAGQLPSPPPINTVVDKGTVTITTTLTVPTAFLGITGLNQIVFDLKTISTAGSSRLEVALVLDTSGSMAGTKISTLKTAATNLTNTLFNLALSSDKVDPVKMSVVPFASSVNIGSSNRTSGWMDTAGKATHHYENFENTTRTRFNLFDDMGVSWAGCVEERLPPYDVTDDAPTKLANPTAEQAKTLFQPMFAPDEPDNWSSSNANDYLSDKGKSANCGTVATTTSSNEQAAQKRVCKYKGVSPSSGTAMGIPNGPNFMCNSTAITPLTITQSTVLTAISNLVAVGATNITAGITWGWRTLSPGEPFTQGRTYTEPDNKKVLILMTDGENTYYPDSTFNKSSYGAWSYLSNSANHLGSYMTSESTVEARMDARSKLACDNVKATGIIIYTIAFQVTTTRGKELMAYCASDSSKSFDASNNSELLAAFDTIGTDISQLRISN